MSIYASSFLLDWDSRWTLNAINITWNRVQKIKEKRKDESEVKESNIVFSTLKKKKKKGKDKALFKLYLPHNETGVCTRHFWISARIHTPKVFGNDSSYTQIVVAANFVLHERYSGEKCPTSNRCHCVLSRVVIIYSQSLKE